MKRRIFLAVAILVGLGGFVAIPLVVGLERCLEGVGRVGWMGILAYTVVMAFGILAPAIAWWILLRAETDKASLGMVIRACWMAWPVNFATPSLYLGGEPVRMLFISRATGLAGRRVLATVIVGKFQEFVGLVLMMVVSVWLVVWKTETLTKRTEEWLIGGTAACVLLLGLLLWAMLGRWNLSVRILGLLRRVGLLRGRFAALREKALEMEEVIRETFTKRWRRYFVSQAVVLFSALGLFARPMVYHVFTAEPEELSVTHVSMVYVITNTVNTVQIIPGSLGMLEGGVWGYFTLAEDPAMTPASAAAMMIVNRIADLVVLFVGVALLAHAGMVGTARALAAKREPTVLAPSDATPATSPSAPAGPSGTPPSPPAPADHR